MKSSDSIIIVVVVSYRKLRTFSVDIYYWSVKCIRNGVAPHKPRFYKKVISYIRAPHMGVDGGVPP